MSNEVSLPVMLSIKQAAQLTNLSPTFIRRLVWENKVIYIKSGVKYLINRDSLIRLLNGETENDIR